MDDLRIAAVCMQCVPGEIESNLERVETMAQEASANGAGMICFPELCVTGYIQEGPEAIYGPEEMHEIAERLLSIAENSRIVLMAGLIEISNSGKPYIAHMVAGPEGRVGCYRKTHLGPTETMRYGQGESLDVFTFGKTRFGIELCYEGHFPEISTRMALKGADILFIPHASPRGEPEEKLESWMRHLPARAFDNGVFVVACNQVGDAGGRLVFPGVAVAFGPDGRVLAQYLGKAEYILYVDLRNQFLRDVRRHRMRYFLPGRRPALYRRKLSNEDH